MAIEFLVTAVLSWLSLGLWCAAASVFAVYFCFHSILFFWVDAIVLLKPPHGRLHFAWQFDSPRGAPGQHWWTQPDVVIDLHSWPPPQPDGCSRSSRRIDWLLIVSVHSSIHQSRLLPFFSSDCIPPWQLCLTPSTWATCEFTSAALQSMVSNETPDSKLCGFCLRSLLLVLSSEWQMV